MSTQTLYLLFAIETALAAVACCVVLTITLRNNRRHIKQLSGQLKQKRLENLALEKSHSIPQYLKREWRQTALSSPEEGSLKASIRMLRLLWLDVELRALRGEGTEASDGRIIESVLTPFFQSARDLLPDSQANDLNKLLTTFIDPPNLPESLANEINPPIDTVTQQLYLRLADQRKSIGRLHHILGDDSETHPLLNRADRVRQQQTEYAQSLEENLRTAHHSAQHLRQYLDRTEPFFIVKHNSDSKQQTSPEFDMEALTETFEESRKDLRALQEVNREQRDLILELEEKLVGMNGRNGPEAREAFELLKRQLREYQICTQILEWESDDLRSVIDSLKGQVGITTESVLAPSRQEPAPISRTVVKQPGEPDNQTEHEKALLQALLNANTYERLSLCLKACCNHKGWDAQLLVYGATQTLEFSSEPGNREIKALRSLPRDSRTPWSELGGQPVAMFNGVRAVLTKNGGQAVPVENLFTEFSAAEQVIARLQEMEKNKFYTSTLSNLEEDAQRSLLEMYRQLKHVYDEVRKVQTKTQDELKRRLEQLNLANIHQRILLNTVDEPYRQITLRIEHGLQVGTAISAKFKKQADQRRSGP